MTTPPTAARTASPWPRRIGWSLWAALPVAALAFHLSAGEPLTQRDRAADLLAKAQPLATSQEADDLRAAADLLAQARALLPAQSAQRHTLALQEARLRAEGGQLVEAQSALTDLLADPAFPTDLASLARAELAATSYHLAWALRLEGAPEDEWRPESDTARRHQRLLAETSTDPAAAAEHRENLETIIRFEQLSDDELRAQAPPKACQNCNNPSQSKRQQKLSKSPSKKPSDARQDIQKGASDAAKRGEGS